MSHGCCISFHQPNVIFGVVWDWLLVDRVTVISFFDFYDLNAKILKLNQHQPPQSVLKEARCRCRSCSSAPAGQSAAVGGDVAPLRQLPPTGSPLGSLRPLVVIWAHCCRRTGCCPHTLPESAHYFFFVSTLRHTFCLISTSAIPFSFTLTFLKCAFELCVCARTQTTLMFVSKIIPEDFIFSCNFFSGRFPSLL